MTRCRGLGRWTSARLALATPPWVAPHLRSRAVGPRGLVPVRLARTGGDRDARRAPWPDRGEEAVGTNGRQCTPRAGSHSMTAEPITRLRGKSSKVILGLISGTSADGITAAVARIAEQDPDHPQ